MIVWLITAVVVLGVSLLFAYASLVRWRDAAIYYQRHADVYYSTACANARGAKIVPLPMPELNEPC